MTTILQKARERYERRVSEREKNIASTSSEEAKEAKEHNPYPQPVRIIYTYRTVEIPSDFLAPLPDPSVIKVEKIDFQNSVLNEYRNLYAVVLDNVLTKEECDELVMMAEMSQGAHLTDEEGPKDDGWQPARVNAGMNYEVFVPDYRNSDRIVWDEEEVTKRLWERVLQADGMKEYFGRMEGDNYKAVGVRSGEKWAVTKQGLNKRMRFLKYGPGQFFKGMTLLHAY
jgi:hypothetical protein